MYLRETKRRNADGSAVAYLALAQNERDPETGVPRARIIHRFGRADQVDREALARLVRSISRFLDPSEAVAATASGEVRIIESRTMGSAWLADRLWERLEIGKTISNSATGRRFEAERVERAIFAMVANRLSVRPLSKLAGCEWVAERAFIEGLAAVSDDECYRAMDFLHAALPELQERVFFTVASLLDLEVDLLFFDTTSTYWETSRLPEELQHDDEQPGPMTTMMMSPRRGSRAAGATRRAVRIIARICRRWWSGWRSRARGSRSGCGRSPATPPIR